MAKNVLFMDVFETGIGTLFPRCEVGALVGGSMLHFKLLRSAKTYSERATTKVRPWNGSA